MIRLVLQRFPNIDLPNQPGPQDIPDVQGVVLMAPDMALGDVLSWNSFIGVLSTSLAQVLRADAQKMGPKLVMPGGH